MTTLTIVRGISGAGKSTWAKAQVGKTLVEADQYFVDPVTGVYNFNPSKIGEAHKWCQNTVRTLLLSGRDVVVANTFTKLWEITPYLEMGFVVEVVEIKTRYQNTHGVPASAVEAMAARWENINWEGMGVPVTVIK